MATLYPFEGFCGWGVDLVVVQIGFRPVEMAAHEGRKHLTRRLGCTMACMERQMTKPRGYRQEAAEQLLCLFVLCLPYYQSLLFAGMNGVLSFLLLTFLLMFVVARSPAAYRVITTCVKALPALWVPPTSDRRDRWVRASTYLVVHGPSLAPSFQRPPPLFS
jgi:hypothetical protein